MDQVVLWKGLLGLIEQFYPKAGGRKPYPPETLLRIHLLQNWFSLSDPSIEQNHAYAPLCSPDVERFDSHPDSGV